MEFVVLVVLMAFFCGCCAFAGRVEVEVSQDPFVRPPRMNTASRATGLTLEAIIIVDGRPQASLVARGKQVMLGRGGKVDGFTVAAIKSDAVVLTKGRLKRELRVN